MNKRNRLQVGNRLSCFSRISPVTRTFRTSVSRFLKIKEKVGEGRVVV